MELDNFIAYFFRWMHLFAGVAWVGLLYYFNFVQTEYFKVAPSDAKASAISQLVPRALKWFRFAALGTFLSGLALAGFLGSAVNFYLTLGMLLGTLMFLNVWIIIWPNQKIIMASNEQVLNGGAPLPEAAMAQTNAALSSRTNTLFSLPMLFFMGASSHLDGIGRVPMSMEGSVGPLAAGACILLIALLELNSIRGKMGPMASVVGVVHCGVALAIALLLIIQFLS